MSKILFLTARFPPDLGGVASSACRISNHLCRLGWQVDVVTWSHDLAAGEVNHFSPKDFHSPDIYRLGLYGHWDMTMIHTLNFLDCLQRKKVYQIVWGHYLFPAGFLAVWFAGLHNLNSIVSARGNDVDKNIFPPGDFARLQWTLQQADAICVVSKDLEKKIKLIGARENIFVLKNAVDSQIFLPLLSREEKLTAKQKLNINSQDIVLGFSGELREKKGQNFLWQGFEKVRKNYPNTTLLIVGEVRETLKNSSEIYVNSTIKNQKKIIITGHLLETQAIVKYLQICDFFLLPSLWEGLPNALLEAMSCACVCIASDAGGIPEIIQSGVNGFILPRQQLSYLGEAILECLELDLEKREQIGVAARKHVETYFSLLDEEKHLQEILNYFSYKL